MREIASCLIVTSKAIVQIISKKCLSVINTDYLINEVFKYRCPITKILIGTHPMIIMRWNEEKPFTLNNMVLTTVETANKHHGNGFQPYSKEIVFFSNYYQ